MSFCDFCTCDDCRYGTRYLSNALTSDGRHICDVCYSYDLCTRNEPGVRKRGKNPCENKDCEHRPKLVGEWIKFHNYMNAKIKFIEKPIFNYPYNKFMHTTKIDGVDDLFSLCFIMNLKLDELTYMGYAFLLIDPNETFQAGTKFQCLAGTKVILDGEFI